MEEQSHPQQLQRPSGSLSSRLSARRPGANPTSVYMTIRTKMLTGDGPAVEGGGLPSNADSGGAASSSSNGDAIRLRFVSIFFHLYSFHYYYIMLFKFIFIYIII